MVVCSPQSYIKRKCRPAHGRGKVCRLTTKEPPPGIPLGEGARRLGWRTAGRGLEGRGVFRFLAYMLIRFQKEREDAVNGLGMLPYYMLICFLTVWVPDS